MEGHVTLPNFLWQMNINYICKTMFYENNFVKLINQKFSLCLCYICSCSLSRRTEPSQMLCICVGLCRAGGCILKYITTNIHCTQQIKLWVTHRGVQLLSLWLTLRWFSQSRFFYLSSIFFFQLLLLIDVAFGTIHYVLCSSRTLESAMCYIMIVY